MQLKWHLSHAQGYLELGMLKQAAAELEKVPAEAQVAYEYIALRAALLQEQQAWKPLSRVAEHLVRLKPEEPSGWVIWAYATRRGENLPAATKILEQAELLHPTSATIKFNLGCYACQRGGLAAAQLYIDQAIALDKSFRALALSDPDLAPLRENSFDPSDPRSV